MSSTPSRSEIETALSGRTKRQEAKPKRPRQPSFDLEAPPRRQQVIGGKLTGISSGQKRRILGRYGDISLSFWVSGGVVLLILLAFFWPQSSDPTLEVTEAQAKTRSDIISSIEPVNDAEDNNDSAARSTFTRDRDMERANQFRFQDEQNLKIEALMTNAKAQLDKDQYTHPKDDNAAASYKAVLALNPNHVDAKHGLSSIKDRFLAAGSDALDSNNEKAAQSALKLLVSIDANSSERQELASAIDRWKVDKQLEVLISDADQALSNDKLILPANENALFYYREALKLDSDNKAANKGIEKVASTYIERANIAVLAGEYQTAAAHLATVSVIDPSHSSIALIEELMIKSKPLVQKVERSKDDANIVTKDDRSTPDKNDLDPKSDEATALATSTTPPKTTTVRPEKSSKATSTNNKRTPPSQTSEQADFDRQYLKRGLEAYYAGQYETAAALLQPLADKGVARAQFRLAYMHYLGRGFKRDRQEADRRIRAALPAIRKFADQGRAWAQSDIGSLYEDGLVLPRDFGEAVYWYRSAAEQGYPGAQTNLGLMYARGRGVSSSRRTAIRWFQRAAKQGDDVAKRNLKALGVN